MIRTLIFVFLTGFYFSGTADGQQIFFDDFNSENGGTGAEGFTGFDNFTVSSGSVDLVGGGLADALIQGNGLGIDLNGNPAAGGPGTLVSNEVFSPGTYEVSFSLGNNTDFDGTNFATVSFGSFEQVFSSDDLDIEIAPSGDVTLDQITLQIALTSSSALTFTAAPDTDAAGIILDDVSVTLVAVPEPGSLPVLLTLGLAYFGRRRR